MDPYDLAVKFHEVYEKLAPSFGYETREETRKFNPDSKNGRLMIAVFNELFIGPKEEIENLRLDVERHIAIASRLLSQEDPWLDIETAPKDSTLILLLVSSESNLTISQATYCNPTEDGHLFRTIGHNSFDNNSHDEWQFAGWNWEQDCFIEGRGTPVGWLPLPQLPLE